MDNIREKIKGVAGDVFKCEVFDETSQVNCESWNSLNHLNFIVELEMIFDVSFEPEEIGDMKSIAIVEKTLNLKMSEKI